MTNVQVRYRRAARAEALSFEGEVMRWAGEAIAQGPLLGVELHGSFARAAQQGDAKAMDQPGFALPPSLLDELACRCVRLGTHESLASSLALGEIRDLRWRRALHRAVGFRSGAALLQPRDGSPQTLLQSNDAPSHLQRVPERLLCLYSERLLCLGTHGWELPLEKSLRHALLFAMNPVHSNEQGSSLGVSESRCVGSVRAANPSGLQASSPSWQRAAVAVASWARRGGSLGVFVRIIGEQGEVLSAFAGRCPGYPQHWHLSGARLWLAGDDFVVALEGVEPAAPPADTWPDCWAQHPHDRRGMWSLRPIFDGTWLAIPHRYRPSESKFLLRILRLEDGSFDEHERCESASPVWHDGALWCTSYQGLWRCQPGERPRIEEKGPCYGVAFDQGRIWLGGPARCNGRAIEGVTEATYGVHLAPCGAVFHTLFGWHVANARRALASSELTGDFSMARFDAGLIAVGAGADTALVDDGGVRARIRMPHDGAWLGATREAFVYGNKQAGIERVPCEDLVAVSLDGLGRERLPWRGRWRALRPTLYADGSTTEHGLVTGDGVWLSSAQGELAQWRPFAEQAQDTKKRRVKKSSSPTRSNTAEAASAVVFVRGLSARGFHTVNPRDDWPVPGWEGRDCEALLQDCVLGGTTGVAHAADVVLGAGACVVLERCELLGGALELQDYSSAFLFDCNPSITPTVDQNSYVVTVSADST